MTDGVAALILAGNLLGGCGGGPTAPTAVDVSGTWDASFAGIVQGVGTTQTDDFTMELSQSGTTVSGFLYMDGVPRSGWSNRPRSIRSIHTPVGTGVD